MIEQFVIFLTFNDFKDFLVWKQKPLAYKTLKEQFKQIVLENENLTLSPVWLVL